MPEFGVSQEIEDNLSTSFRFFLELPIADTLAFYLEQHVPTR
jgi:hypothetical protein